MQSCVCALSQQSTSTNVTAQKPLHDICIQCNNHIEIKARKKNHIEHKNSSNQQQQQHTAIQCSDRFALKYMRTYWTHFTQREREKKLSILFIVDGLYVDHLKYICLKNFTSILLVFPYYFYVIFLCVGYCCCCCCCCFSFFLPAFATGYSVQLYAQFPMYFTIHVTIYEFKIVCTLKSSVDFSLHVLCVDSNVSRLFGLPYFT